MSKSANGSKRGLYGKTTKVVVAVVAATLGASVFAMAANINVSAERLTTHVFPVAASPTPTGPDCGPPKTLPADADSWISAGSPTQNNGDATALNAKAGSIEFKGHTSNNNGGGATSITIAKPAEAAVGDLMVAQITIAGRVENISGAPNGWLTASNLQQDNGNRIGTKIYGKFVTVSEPASYTWNFGSNTVATGGIGVFSDVETNASLTLAALSVNNANNQTTATALSLSPAVGNTKLVAFFGTQQQRVHSEPPGMTQVYLEGSNGMVSSMNHEGWSTSGATGNRTTSWIGNSAWVSVFVAVRPASEAERTLVRFPTVSVPSGCAIGGATLSLFRDSTLSDRTITVERITASWTESGGGSVTWNNAPATTTVNTSTSVTSATNNQRQQWDVTQQVLAMYSLNAHHGFMLMDTGSGNAHQRYRSREHTTEADRPTLTLTFVPAP